MPPSLGALRQLDSFVNVESPKIHVELRNKLDLVHVNKAENLSLLVFHVNA